MKKLNKKIFHNKNIDIHVEWDVAFNLVLTSLGLCPSNYLLLVIVNIKLQ